MQETIVGLIEKLWEKEPNKRFGQIIEDIKNSIGTTDLLFTEDQVVVETLLSLINS